MGLMMIKNRSNIAMIIFPTQSNDCASFGFLAGSFAANFISFMALGVIAFQLNLSYLFNGLDGNLMLIMNKQQSEWNEPMLGFTNNFFQSMGNVWFPLNTRLIPGYFFSEFLNSGELNPISSYLIFSAEIFITTYLLCSFLRLGSTIAALAAWLLNLLVMPFFASPLVVPMLQLVPHITTVIAATLLILILFWQIGRKSWAVSSISVCVAGLLLGYLIVTQPDKLLLMAPVISVFGLCSIVNFQTKNELYTKLLCAGLLIVSLLLSGSVEFLSGIFRYTVAMYFSQELINDRSSWYFVSILFHNHQPYAGPIMFTAGFIGALMAVTWGSGPARSFARGTLVAMAFLLLAGVSNIFFPEFWKGPGPLYFELLLWPFYAAYGTVAIFVVVRLFTESMRRLLLARPELPLSFLWLISNNNKVFACVTVAILPWLVFACTRGNEIAGNISWQYPPHRTPIVNFLEQEVGLSPKSPFRGRAATFTGLLIDRPITWLDLHGNDFELIKKFGNDHRMTGLWYYKIPTLSENSNFISPAFYLVTSRLLGLAGDQQNRSVMTLRDIDPRILRMMGVRFLITDAPITAEARLRIRIPEVGAPVLMLYELEDVNLGDYSPTEIVQVEDARSAMSILASSVFDPMKIIVVNAPLPGRFIPATSSRLFVEKSGLRLSASSEGTSVLLLPLEYSHCLNIESTGAIAPLRLFRANLLQTGVVFTGNIEVTLSYFTGPFRNSACRMDDARDMDRLKIGEQVTGG
jgi:hypothetical protein